MYTKVTKQQQKIIQIASFMFAFYGAAFKNAAILAVAYFPRTLLMAAVTVVIPYLLFNVTRLLPLFFILGISLPAYFCALMYTPIFKKMIGNTEEEDRPWVLDEEENEGKQE